MAGPSTPPPFREISPTMRVDVFLDDWRSEIPPEAPAEARERRLYDRAWAAYQEGDYGFGLWCWKECDRLTVALGGRLAEVNRVLGPGRYFGFAHRRAVAERVPLDRLYRPRRGDMSTPRTDAFVLPHYQVLCVYLVQAAAGDPKVSAQLAIALGELEDQRRADPMLRQFETFRELLARSATSAPSPPSSASPTGRGTPASEPPTRPGSASRRSKTRPARAPPS
ncbi:MAG: hypothetical protein ACYCPN_06860 [Thermoplasmata archaeon]